MEGAHRRHQADRAARAPWLEQLGPEPGHRADHLHAGWASRSPAAASARVAVTSSSNSGTRSGATSSTAARCRATVASSPRATGPVSARFRAQPGPVLDGRAHERHEQFALDTHAGGDSLGRRLERHQEVGGDRRGGVIGGPVLVGDLDGTHSEGLGERRGQRQRPRGAAGDRRSGAGEIGTVRGHGHQRDATRTPRAARARQGRSPPSSGRRAVPGRSAAAARAISPSGTHSSTASAPTPSAPRPSGPDISYPARPSAPASAASDPAPANNRQARVWGRVRGEVPFQFPHERYRSAVKIVNLNRGPSATVA